MQVILLEKIRNLGNLGDEVKVKPGFGRNFLVPQGKAVFATAQNRSKFEARRADLEKTAAAALANAKSRADVLSALTIEIKVKASEEGKLFGSVTPKDIIDAIAAKGQSITKSEIEVPKGVIRQIGEYDIKIHLYSDLAATIKVNVVSE